MLTSLSSWCLIDAWLFIQFEIFLVLDMITIFYWNVDILKLCCETWSFITSVLTGFYFSRRGNGGGHHLVTAKWCWKSGSPWLLTSFPASFGIWGRRSSWLRLGGGGLGIQAPTWWGCSCSRWATVKAPTLQRASTDITLVEVLGGLLTVLGG